jgi:hypothetical protein
MREARRVPAGCHALPARLHADQPHAGIVPEGVEQTDGVRAAAHARHARIGQPAGLGHDLSPRLIPDHRLEVAHDGRVGVRAERGAEQVVRVAHGRHPVADRLVDGVFQGACARIHRPHLRAEQFHAQDVRLLPGDVHCAHVDHALQPQQRGRGGRGDPVLPRARLRDHPALADALRQERLPQRVVDLVRAGMRQILAFEVDLRAARVAGQPPGMGQGGRPADVGAQQVVQLGRERRILPARDIRFLQFGQRRHQRLGHELPAEGAEFRIAWCVLRGAYYVLRGAWRVKCEM